MDTAVVTGASRGIGYALAKRLVAEGFQVVVNDLDASDTRHAAEEIGALAIPGDAASERGVSALVEAARAELGSIDVWFGNAGIDRGRGLTSTDAEWEDSWEVNVMAHVRAARLLMPEWLDRGAGRYVVTASAAGLLMMVDAPAYTVTKHGAVAFAEWLSATYRHRGITVQAICPQGVRTRMLEESGSLAQMLSHDGALTPDQIAEAAWRGLQGDQFLVLPHPEVAEYVAGKGRDHDAWLAGMNRIHQRVESLASPPE